MIKITHYEVYTDHGRGWQLEDRFAIEQRQDAFNLAKELELDKIKVKIIKEVFDVQDNSYQETVEYVSNLSRKNKNEGLPSSYPGIKKADEREEEEQVEEVVESTGGGSILSALIKLVALTLLCLALANVLVSLIFPVIENFIPDEQNSRPILFVIFFVIFLSIAVPLILRYVPWYVFVERRRPVAVKEKTFYDKAGELIDFYNLNDDVDPIVTPAYPEAPLEYKQYLITFLTDLLSNLKSPTATSTSFSKFGIKLIVYGGCLEMARYSGLGITEANSILYDAFRITDGDGADLEAFYEAKRTYKDNKVAVFLTGVGAYLMAHVIKGRQMPTELLNLSFSKWEKQNKTDEIVPVLSPVPEEPETPVPDDVLFDALVSIKSDLKFLDDSIPNRDEVAAQTSAEIRNIIFNLLGKYKGEDTSEADGITTIHFPKISNAVRFAVECLKDIGTYQEETNNDNLILRNCCAVTEDKPENEPNLSERLSDIFEHIYNQEIVVTKPVFEALQESGRHFDYLGEKTLNKLNINVELYKLLD